MRDARLAEQVEAGEMREFQSPEPVTICDQFFFPPHLEVANCDLRFSASFQRPSRPCDFLLLVIKSILL